ncbi:MAG: DUF2948 family protein [Rhizobiaceae bacterium]
MSAQLKLIALDADDLDVISAHVQDAVMKASEIEYLPATKQLVLPINRFAWEAKTARRLFFKKYQRRSSVLHFDQIENVKTKAIDRKNADQILSLLAISFIPNPDAGDPSGTINLTFADGAEISAKVECIEAQLADLGAAWEARGKPRHRGA